MEILKFVFVSGVQELFGVDINQPYETRYDVSFIHSDVPHIELLVTAKFDFEDEPRKFSVSFICDVQKHSFQAIVNGARIFFTSAPSEKSLRPSGSTIEPQDMMAIRKEYGGCHVDLDEISRDSIRMFMNKHQ